jgi:hypothetical protein
VWDVLFLLTAFAPRPARDFRLSCDSASRSCLLVRDPRHRRPGSASRGLASREPATAHHAQEHGTLRREGPPAPKRERPLL